MDVDDEFGDLYSDVLVSSTAPVAPAVSPNLNYSVGSVQEDDDDVLYGLTNPKAAPPVAQRAASQGVPAPEQSASESVENIGSGSFRVSEVGEIGLVKAPVDGGVSKIEDADVGIEQGIAKIEEIGVDDVDALNSEKVPGLASREPPSKGFPSAAGGDWVGAATTGSGVPTKEDACSEDWDSDSEDDLQIVLNDQSDPVGANFEKHQEIGSEDEDEDGDDLVIVAGDDVQVPHQAMEEQEDGDETAQLPQEGDKKEAGDAARVNAAVPGSIGGRMGYNNHGYYPHHSQFKYVRPGVTPNNTAGAPGQVRPAATLAMAPGRGRGDWRPTVGKAPTIGQKGFHSGFGVQAWANHSAGRGFGSGSEFTLPSHKTVFDIDIDAFEDKPWRHPGVDVTDYFNFGLDENNWKNYCKQLEQLRLEATMQSKIRVYESGRSDQDYDPDLPPELAAAAGLHDVSTDIQLTGKVDGGQSDIMGHGRGKAIQVEGGYGERLPSIDTRPPRHRDSDAIIEIVLQGSVDDDSVSDTQGKLENELQETDYKEERHEVKVVDKQSDIEPLGNFSQPYSGRRRELFMQGNFLGPLHGNMHGEPFPSEANLRNDSIDKGQTTISPVGAPSSHQERWLHEAAVREKNSSISSEPPRGVLPTENIEMNRSSCSGEEHSEGSKVPKESTEVSSPEEDVEGSKHSLAIEEPDNVDTLAVSLEAEGEVALDLQVPNETSGDGSSVHSARRQKLTSRIEQPVSEDHSEDTKTNRSDDSKPKPVSSKDHLRRRDSGDEEVVQNGRSSHIADAKRHYFEDESGLQRRDDYVQGGRQDVDRSRVSLKGREDYHHRSSNDAYAHKEWDGNSSYHARTKTEGYDRLKERDSLTWQRRDDDVHARRQKEEEARRRDRVDDASSKARNRALESGRNSKEEHAHLKKRYEDGDWRGYHDKEVRRSRERDVLLSGQHDNVDDPHAKRRKEIELHRRDRLQKEDVGHTYGSKEDLSRRRRDRDDSLERRRREDPGRMRDKPDDQHLIRHRDSNRDSNRRQREDRHRIKPSHEDTQVNWDREARAPGRSGQISEDQIRLGNSRIESRAKDEPRDSGKDHKRRHSELPKGRDKVEEESYPQHRAREDLHVRDGHLSNEDRSLRHERLRSQSDHLSGANEGQHSYRERSKERPRKGNESEMGDRDVPARGDRDGAAPNTADKPGKAAVGKRKLDDRSTYQRNEKATKKGSFASETDNGLRRVQEQETTHQQRSSKSQKHSDEGGSDDEDMRKGRSKLERWTSHKDSNSAPILKAHDSEAGFSDHNHGLMVEQDMSKTDDFKKTEVAEVEENIASIVPKESAVDTLPHMSEHGYADNDANGDDKHLETVAKLKKRSERFKLPMLNEKEISRRVESEASVQMEATEVKQERPARKRRWVNN
ncbi:FIP1[V]-like protein [Nymphaea thermarum]|nr:FIP1[V]-like protein [Nymphaea thermarum]